ncbi:MAG: hypothetical protein RL173_22 [Fibrobacterota bacterium]|jgi:hypothetical protein
MRILTFSGRVYQFNRVMPFSLLLIICVFSFVPILGCSSRVIFVPREPKKTYQGARYLYLDRQVGASEKGVDDLVFSSGKKRSCIWIRSLGDNLSRDTMSVFNFTLRDEWELVYGRGYCDGDSYNKGLHSKEVYMCDSGLTLMAESIVYTNCKPGNPKDYTCYNPLVEGVAKDSAGNTFKVFYQ